MADSKISELTALSSPADDDIFAIVDTDAGQTKKITAANVKTYAGFSTEAVQDIVGAMFSSNTETDIAATYEDGDGTVDLVVSVSAGNLPTAIDAAKLGDGSVSNAEFQRLDGVTSDIQTQLDAKQATLTFGIANTNVPKFTTGVADDDFLRIAGTTVEGRSASEVLSDIGGQASLTFGISNTNAVKVDSSSVADDEYARFTSSGLESRSTAEVLSDIGGQAALSFGISNTNIPIFTSGVVDDDFLRVAGTSIEGRSASEVLSDIGGQATLTFGISNTNAVKIDSASVADDEYARFTANGLESRSTTEVLSDIGGITASSSDTLTNKSIDSDNNTITNIVNADIKSSAAVAFSKMENLTASRALVSDGSGDVSAATTTSTEIGYVNGVTSAIQTQLDAKASKGLAVAMAIAL
jgi:hypothetical protein